MHNLARRKSKESKLPVEKRFDLPYPFKNVKEIHQEIKFTIASTKNFVLDFCKNKPSNVSIVIRDFKHKLINWNDINLIFNKKKLETTKNSHLLHIPNRYLEWENIIDVSIKNMKPRSIILQFVSLDIMELNSLKKLIEDKPPFKRKSNLNDENEIIIDKQIVSLCDVYSKIRIGIPIRGNKCQHFQCSDLDTYLRYGIESNNWKCLICDNLMHFETIFIDQEMKKVLSSIKADKVTFFGDGSWENDSEKNEVIDLEDEEVYQKYVDGSGIINLCDDDDEVEDVEDEEELFDESDEIDFLISDDSGDLEIESDGNSNLSSELDFDSEIEFSGDSGSNTPEEVPNPSSEKRRREEISNILYFSKKKKF